MSDWNELLQPIHNTHRQEKMTIVEEEIPVVAVRRFKMHTNVASSKMNVSVSLHVAV